MSRLKRVSTLALSVFCFILSMQGTYAGQFVMEVSVVCVRKRVCVCVYEKERECMCVCVGVCIMLLNISSIIN